MASKSDPWSCDLSMKSKGNSRQGDDSGDSELHVNMPKCRVAFRSLVVSLLLMLAIGVWMMSFPTRADTHTHTIPSLKLILYPETFIPKAHVINRMRSCLHCLRRCLLRVLY